MQRTVRGIAIGVRALVFGCTLLMATAVGADMPARNDYWAKTDAIVSAADGFPPRAVAAFAVAVRSAESGSNAPHAGPGPGYANVREYEFFRAIETLIKPELQRGEIRTVKDFLASVSNAEGIRGRLIARDGGDFVTVLELVTGQDGQYVLRRFNRALGRGVWQGTTFDHPLGVAAGPGPHPDVGRRQTEVVYDNQNIGRVYNLPVYATTFTLSQPYVITKVTTYHWNDARGAPPGTLALVDGDGRVFGPWPAHGSRGQGGVRDAYWTATPDTALPAGTYAVVDSDPGSWAQNHESQRTGFVRIEGFRNER